MHYLFEIKHNEERNRLAGRLLYFFAVFIFLFIHSGCSVFHRYDAPSIERYLPRSIQEPVLIHTPDKEEGSEHREGVTLPVCIRIALAKNPMQQAAREGVAVAKAAVGIAQSPYYPEMNLNSAYNYWETHAFMPEGFTGGTQPTTIGPTNDWSFGVKASYVLFDSGARAAKLRNAMAQQGISIKEANRIRQNIAFEVNKKFYSVIYALEAQKVAEGNLKRTQELLRVAKLKESVGVTTHADAIRSQVEVANARLELVKAERNIRISRGSLNTVLGLPVEQEFELIEKMKIIPPSTTIDFQEALKQAIHTRQEVKAALHRIGAAESSVLVAKSAFGPRVQVHGGYGYRDTEFLPEDEDWSVGIAIELPLFQGFYRTHTLTKTKHALLKEEAEIRQLILQVKEEVWTAYQQLHEAKESIKAAEMLIKNAKESLQVSKQRYEAGVSTMNELLDVQTALARAELIAVESRRQYHFAKAALEHATGTILHPK